MNATNKQFSIWAASMVASLAAAFAAVGATQAESDTLRCEVAAAPSGGMTSIRALAHVGEAVTGTYELTVSGAGTDIRQGGPFEAAAGETVTLGSATLGGSARDYDVTLEVTAGGRTVQCADNVGGWL